MEVDPSDRICTTDRGKASKAVVTDTWVGVHIPQRQSDLAITKSKILEIAKWLETHKQKAVRPQVQCKAPILLLTGPAGSGKTTCIQVLAKELHIEIHEWANPDMIPYDADSAIQDWQDFNMIGGPINQSQPAVFQRYILRANRYSALDLCGCQATSRTLCLVEDIPNVFYRQPQMLHNILYMFSTQGRSPLVFIISDTYNGENCSYQLFPSDVKAALDIVHISLNPVPPTSLLKVLTRIVDIESKQGEQTFTVPSRSALQAIAHGCAGDIRSAVNNLQFACLKDTKDLAVCRPPKRMKSSSKDAKKSMCQTVTTVTTDDSQLTAIGSKDIAVDFFRALGKIFYAKRIASVSSKHTLPTHLAHHERDLLMFNPEDVLDRTQMSSERFNLYLHQNYLQFYEKLEDVVQVSAYFSHSDQFTSDWRSRSAMMPYAESVTSRAVIHCNTGRAQSDNTANNRWTPFHKPQWFDVIRKHEERIAQANGLFASLHKTSGVLLTEVLPFMALMKVHTDNPGQNSFLKDVISFKPNQFTTRRFATSSALDDMEDEAEDRHPDEELLISESRPGPKLEASNDLTEEEEYIIEEF